MPEIGLGAAAGLGFILGLRHAFEPDHLAAVSTLATRQGHTLDGARLGVAWGVGHTASIAGATLLVALTGLQLPPSFSAIAELLVAVLLVLLGLPILYRYAAGRWHMHTHAHESAEGEGSHLHLHSHALDAAHAHTHPRWDARRSLLLGVAHGLAGSAALVVLLLTAASTLAARIGYFLAFGAGTILGMLAVSLGLGALAVIGSRQAREEGEGRGGAGDRKTGGRGQARWAEVLHVVAALASVLAGIGLAVRVAGHVLIP